MLSPLPRAVTIHGLYHARLALAPGRPVLLLSAPGAASYAGAAWWRAMVEAALEGHPHNPDTPALDAIDCANHPGRALEALATHCRIVILLPCPATPTILERAPPATILQARPPSLDLARPGARRHLQAWLQGDNPPGIG